jgi:hypothetical protein
MMAVFGHSFSNPLAFGRKVVCLLFYEGWKIVVEALVLVVHLLWAFIARADKNK